MTYQLDTATKNSKKNRKRLEDARAFLDATLTNLATAIVVIDKKNKIKLYNKSAANLLGFKASNMVDENLTDAIKDLKKFDAVINLLMKPKKKITNPYIVQKKFL